VLQWGKLVCYDAGHVLELPSGCVVWQQAYHGRYPSHFTKDCLLPWIEGCYAMLARVGHVTGSWLGIGWVNACCVGC
jgi:hypothetical protein